MEEHEFLLVLPEEEGERIDKALKVRFPSYSRAYFQYLIEEGCVLINGERVKKKDLLEEGDEIEICFLAIPSSDLRPEKIPLDILYEDEYLLAINKPAGMVVHPAPGNWSGTFVNALLAHTQTSLPGDDCLRPGIVHRLDKDTSGVLLAAKSAEAHRKLIELFSRREIDKLYLALCHGKIENQDVSVPIGRHPVHRKEMAVLPDGKKALTQLQLAAYRDPYSLVIAKPKTGRTHQIRVHLKHLRAPIVGDALYGEKSGYSRHLLHAYRLNFSHPITKEPMKIQAPLPADMLEWIQKLFGIRRLFSDTAFAL